MSKQTEALKLALEALENSRSLEPVDVQWVKGKRHAAIAAIREALAEQPPCKYPNCPYPCPDLPDCRDAEQSTISAEIKADKEQQDTPKIGCVNHDCDKCRGQELDNSDALTIAYMHGFQRGKDFALAEQPAQQEPAYDDDDNVCADCGMAHCECGEKDD